jgi:aryl-alcohol dehydrogenase-like predicted oxidoreductase
MSNTKTMKRRDLLKTAVASSAYVATGIVPRALWAGAVRETQPSSNAASLPRRAYGHTGVRLSMIGFPGFALKDLEQDKANRIVAQAVERGVNYFDVAPSYGDAELRLGPALKPYRKDVFLACKTAQRSRDGASKELEQSLERLGTDHFDLYQLHHITEMTRDVDPVFAKGGAMEVLTEARKEGRIRHLGFSAHSVEAALAAMERFDFDSALVPINFASFHKGRFGPQIVELAQRKGVTLLAIKGLARQKWPERDADRKKFPRCWYQPITDRAEAELSLRFALSQPVAAAIPPADVSLLPLAMDLASGFKPITAEEERRLKTLARDWNPVFTHG